MIWGQYTPYKADTHLRALPFFLCTRMLFRYKEGSRNQIAVGAVGAMGWLHIQKMTSSPFSSVYSVLSYASDTFDIWAVYIDVNDASFILQLKSNWVCLLWHCICVYYYLFFFCICWNMLHIYLFIALDFFLFSFAHVPRNLHLAEEVGVWTIREQKINASTAVWHFTRAPTVPLWIEPKGQLLAEVPGPERKRVKGW